MDDDEGPLTEKEVNDILQAVAAPHSINPATVQLAASIYQQLTDRKRKSSGRGMRKDLGDIARQCRNFADVLTGLPIEIEIMMMTIPKLFGHHKVATDRLSHRSIASQLNSLASDLDRYLKLAKVRLSIFDLTFQLTISCLETGYFYGTGRIITHSSHKNGEHLGEPRSEFGRLVVAFFAVVDPSLSKVSLTTIVRKFVADPERQQAAVERSNVSS